MTEKPKRSDAQRRADAAYYEKSKGKRKSFTATFPSDEVQKIQDILQEHGIGNADLIRRAAARVEQGDDLTGRYDAESGKIVH